MVAAVRSALSALSDALEMACGWVLVAAGLYALLCLDVTGRGSLWSSLRGLSAHAQTPVESPYAVRRMTIAARASAGPPQEDKVFEFLLPKKESDIAVAVPADIARPEAAFTDSPADPRDGEGWMRSLQGRLRSFTIYGEGEQSTSAVVQTQSGAALPAASAPAMIVAAPGSAAAAAAAAARPGVGARLRNGVAARPDSVRNIR